MSEEPLRIHPQSVGFDGIGFDVAKVVRRNAHTSQRRSPVVAINPMMQCQVCGVIDPGGGSDSAAAISVLIWSLVNRCGVGLRCVVGAQARAGDFPGALATARSLGDPRDRAATVTTVAGVQAGAGEIPGALAVARSIDNELWRAMALLYIGDTHVKSANRARSMPRVFGSIGGGVDRD